MNCFILGGLFQVDFPLVIQLERSKGDTHKGDGEKHPAESQEKG